MPADRLPVRACPCSFCRAHGVLSTWDPRGQVGFVMRDPAMVSRYRFGLEVTEFLICGRCGVYMAALSDESSGTFAVLNLNALDCRDEVAEVPVRHGWARHAWERRWSRGDPCWTPVAGVVEQTASEGGPRPTRRLLHSR